MLQLSAKIISYIFQPVFVTFYALIATYWVAPYLFTQPNLLGSSEIIIIFFVNTVLFPVLSIVLMKKLGLLKDIEMFDRSERYIPLISNLVFYIWCAVVSFKSQAPFIVQLLATGAVLTLAISFVVTIFFKTSLHAAGASSMVAFFLNLYYIVKNDTFFLLLASIVVCGLVASSRLIQKKHTVREVWVGICIGIVGVQLANLLLVYLYAT